MKSVGLVTILLILGTFSSTLWAVEGAFEPAKVLDIEQKAKERVLYYLVNTPVTKDDPYYEVTVQVKDVLYVAEFTPVHDSQTLPESWKIDAPIQARVEKHYIVLRQPGETEYRLAITKHSPASPADNDSKSTTPRR